MSTTPSSCSSRSAKGPLGIPSGRPSHTYIVARGTSTWRFTLKAKLPAGKYVAWVRGIDKFNNVERKSRKVNLRRFRIR
jgi:hypothetical protein